MNDKLTFFSALQCLLGLACSNYLPSDESDKSSIGSSELSSLPWSDPYHFNDDEDYSDSVDYLDDFEKPDTSGSNDMYGSFNENDDDDDDYSSFLEEKYALHRSGDFPQEGIYTSDNDYAYDSDDGPQYGIVNSYDDYRHVNKREQTLSGDDDGIQYFSADVPEYVSSTDDWKDDDDLYHTDDTNLF